MRGSMVVLLIALSVLGPPSISASSSHKKAPAAPRLETPVSFDLSGTTTGRWMRDELGLTIVVHHPEGAFPDDVLSRTGIYRETIRHKKVHGRWVKKRHMEVLADPKVFRDDRTLVFIPEGLRFDQPIQLLIFFHGWRGTVTGARPTPELQHLRESVRCAETNSILIVPQGPYNYPTSRFGNLETIPGLTKFVRGLGPLLPGVAGVPSGGAWLERVEHIVLSGHSGGGQPIVKLLEDGAGRSLDTSPSASAGTGQDLSLSSGQNTRVEISERTGRLTDLKTSQSTHLKPSVKPGMTAGIKTADAEEAEERWVWDHLDEVILLDATYSGQRALQVWWEGAPQRVLKSYYLIGTGTEAISVALSALGEAQPERRSQLEIEGINWEQMPDEIKHDAHYSVPWYRLWKGLGSTSGACRWAKETGMKEASSAVPGPAVDESEGNATPRGERPGPEER